MSDAMDKWESRGAVKTLFRRFAFERYAQTRDFMEALSALVQADGVHPQNINFGPTYVNVTLDPTEAGLANQALAERIDVLYQRSGA
ncbi:Pterin 4 alpha carbinolamine dehydratase [Burkholderiaceae bacterium]|jgi:pterin-4a-carbinolamine dehydratase